MSCYMFFHLLVLKGTRKVKCTCIEGPGGMLYNTGYIKMVSVDTLNLVNHDLMQSGSRRKLSRQNTT